MTKIYKQVGDNKIFFSAFNSTFIDPDVAVANKIVRGKDKGLVNIAVVMGSGTGKSCADHWQGLQYFSDESDAWNLFEVREQDAVYYLAPFEFENEDLLTFKISVRADPQKPAYDLKFQKKMYHDYLP